MSRRWSARGLGAEALQINRAAGFPQPTAGERVLGEQFADLLAAWRRGGDVWRGRRLQLVRVMGAAMARLADAIVSAFWSMLNRRCKPRILSGLVSLVPMRAIALLLS